MSRSNERAGFLIVVERAHSVSSPYGVPGLSEIPRVIYSSYLEAKQVLMEVVERFDKFTPVAYGLAYPYENTSFEKEISKHGYATIGWVVKNNEDDEDENEEDSSDENSYHIPIGILRIPISDRS